ncbi:NAD-dependent epimerase/dehydratase family protein [Cohnella rhizosphaerae]|uniref:NAD(P)-dependent oxidoreductase n=1 Tax=Cohnella rhizosphaerae TaxID=1457232 RepID=A0A9X4L033_9BACL|nr:NAD(P)-dependent oxidoreductase [Cohnella rhizosphaerae]MDG0814070.1 NAD(P)-dependent oxidoreductase [Cohnella rhizosphaerae]
MAILITGATGFIGRELAPRLAGSHEVVCLSRGGKALERDDAGCVHVRGSFDRFEDLRQLDAYRIDTVIHLAAVTGGCSEEDGLSVNVLGTRRLFRYLLDRGAERFVSASSVAAPGCLGSGFLPERLPIPDEHPCLATDAYGLSKAMAEQVTHYFHRLHPDTRFVNLRLGAVVGADWTPQPVDAGTKLTIPFVRLSHVYVSDIVAGIVRTAEAELPPGVHTWNLVGPDSSCSIPTADMLRSVLGDRAADYDLSYYEQPGHAHKPVFDMRAIADAIGFYPQRSMRAQPASR